MTQTRAPYGGITAFSAFSVFGLSLLAGFLCAALVYGVLIYADTREQDGRNRERTVHSLELAQSGLERTWNNIAFVAEQAARHLNRSAEADVPAIMEQYSTLWPGSGLSLYTNTAEIRSARELGHEEGVASGPQLTTVREMIYKAAAGRPSRGYAQYRGYLSLSAAMPVMGPGDIRVLVFSVPLDTQVVRDLATSVHADVALLPFEQSGRTPSTELLVASDDELAKAVPGILAASDASSPREAIVPLAERRAFAAVSPLHNNSGDTVGVLLVAPNPLQGHAFVPWRAWCALAAGLCVAALTHWCMRRRERQVAAVVSGVLQELALTEGSSVPDEDLDAFFLTPSSGIAGQLRSALAAVAGLIVRCKADLRKARMAEGSIRPHNSPEAAPPALELGIEPEYRRLFAALPIGAFLAESSGRFLLTNQALASMLGYDSSARLMAECASFADFCLYGDAVRNRIGTLLEQGSGRHTVFLRKRDGQARKYKLILGQVPTADGDISSFVEAFLLDLSRNERIPHTERDRENKQSLSPALLLAAVREQSTQPGEILSESSVESRLLPPHDGVIAEEVPVPPQGATLDVDAAAEELEEALSGGMKPDERQGLRILLVDNTFNDRMLFSMFLRETQHRITEAYSGQDAVELYAQGDYDVIFMDMEMPLMDGYQTTRILRALEADKERAATPIVGMISYALPELRQQCALSGCSEFLPKPFTQDALLSMLDAVTGLREEQQRLNPQHTQ